MTTDGSTAAIAVLSETAPELARNFNGRVKAGALSKSLSSMSLTQSSADLLEKLDQPLPTQQSTLSKAPSSIKDNEKFKEFNSTVRLRNKESTQRFLDNVNENAW